jgi:serine/threonine protein kinase/formylglycine-generating enzyme required for sulfatase activity
MNPTDAGHDLLLGALAVQKGLLSRDALAAALSAWARDPTKPLDQVLLERGDLPPDCLAALVGEYRAADGAAVTPGPAASLAPPSTVDRTEDPFPTHVPASGFNGAGAGASPELRFRVLRPLARGGLGEVFLAQDGELNREVALKEILPRHADDPESRARFLREAEVTGALEHPGVVPVYGLGTHPDGRPYYTMRLIRGETLREAIGRFHAADRASRPPGERNVELRKLLGRFVAVCDAVAYAHSRGILHRDLKPDNIMLGPYGETLVVDWGLAGPVRGPDQTPLPSALRPAGAAEGWTQTGAVIGTPQYMSPEQAAGQADRLGPAADVYSLGATLYQLLTGRAPFPMEGGILDLLLRVRSGDFPRPRTVHHGVPQALEAICLKAMASRPADRYSTARELADDLERWLADEPVRAHREPLRSRLGRWRRRHRALVASLVVLVATALGAAAAGLAAVSREHERTRALGQVEALREASPAAVPLLLADLEPGHEYALPRLRQLWTQDDLPERQRRRIGLALLPHDGSVRARLIELMLGADDPAELLLLREGLAPFAAELRNDLWNEAANPATPGARRFRLLVCLAAFDPGAAGWSNRAPEVVEGLLAANPLHVGPWKDALQPLAPVLVPVLARQMRAARGSERGRLAATILADYAAAQPEVLTAALLEADPRQFEVLWPRVVPHAAAAETLLTRALEEVVPPGATETVADTLASRQANAAATLMRLGQPGRDWPLLRFRPDPRVRSFLIHRLAALGTDPEVLRSRLDVEDNVSTKRALLMALGEYGSDRLPASCRDALSAQALALFRDDPDPGLHGAAEWLLRRLGRGTDIARIEHEVAAVPPPPSRRWYIAPEGHTMVTFPAMTEYVRRTNVTDDGREEPEQVAPDRIPYAFAIASKEVTLGQFQHFLATHPGISYEFIPQFVPDKNCPAMQVTWLHAAQYCRWLSDLEGIPEDQKCFPKVEDINEKMKLPADWLQRTGYRPPTVAEWECACRGGTTTSRCYGSADELLGQYAWYRDNSEDRTHPVGTLKPNDFGLFDMLGNAYEWCMDIMIYTPGIEERKLRGGAFSRRAAEIRSASQNILSMPPGFRDNQFGMRVARTLPARPRP